MILDHEGFMYGDSPKPILYEGVPVARGKLGLWLESPSFELWLAMKCFSGCRGVVEYAE